jgi:signal transduction histidine kinase
MNTNLYPSLSIAKKEPSTPKGSTRRSILMHVTKVSGLAVANATAELVKLSKKLTGGGGDDLHLKSAIETLLNQITVAKAMNISFETGLFSEKGLPKKAKLNIFRVIQEQLNNIVKYANASEVYVSLRRTHQKAYLVIKDNGKGFDLSQKRNGICITDIIECAEMNNGQATLKSGPGTGCQLCAEFSTDVWKTRA